MVTLFLSKVIPSQASEGTVVDSVTNNVELLGSFCEIYGQNLKVVEIGFWIKGRNRDKLGMGLGIGPCGRGYWSVVSFEFHVLG